MPTFKFNKLVRDKIVEHQLASGSKPRYHQLDEGQHKAALVNKIIEEAQEILVASQADVADEIADVQQAIDDLKEKFGLSNSDIAKAQKAKNAKNGSFKNGTFIDEVEVVENDAWVTYYRQNVDRYPEIE